MGLLHAIHFDAGVFPPEISHSSGVVSSTQKRTGTYSGRLNVASNNNFTGYYIRCTLSSSLSEIFLQFGLHVSGVTTGSYTRFLRWEGSDGSVLGGLKINPSNGKIEVYTGDFVSLVATSTVAVSVGTWYLVELHIVIGDSGSIVLRVDLNEEATFSGDTQPAAVTQIGFLRWGGVATYTYIDDIIVHDTTGSYNKSWPDGAKVYYLVPTGDGATKDWTPSAGSDHYALVDEVPPSATDNLQATAVDKVDVLTFGALPGDAQTIKAVIPEVFAFKGSSTAPTRLNLGIDLNGEGVEYSGDQDLALAQGIVRHIWEARPGGGNFSVADIGDLSLYLKSAA